MTIIFLYKVCLDKKDILITLFDCQSFKAVYAARSISVFGGHTGGVTPVPIPNTEVKPSRADGTAWVTVWESRSLPKFLYKAQ